MFSSNPPSGGQCETAEQQQKSTTVLYDIDYVVLYINMEVSKCPPGWDSHKLTITHLYKCLITMNKLSGQQIGFSLLSAVIPVKYLKMSPNFQKKACFTNA